MKITREGVEDVVWLLGMACTTAGAWILGGAGVGLSVAGAVLLGSGLAGAIIRYSRGKPEP